MLAVCFRAGVPVPGRYTRFDDGERSSVGRAPDCDSGRRGFESHRSPHFLPRLIRVSPFFAYRAVQAAVLRLPV